MSTSTPAPKRRRLAEADARSALRKPFKSPFRTPLKANANPSATPAPAPACSNDTTKTNTPSSSAILHPPISHTPSPSTSKSTLPPRRTPGPRNPLPPSSSSTRSSLSNPTLRALTSQIAHLRSDIDTLRQATTLCSSSTDAELAQLSAKWRAATRAAAEELFASVRDRVNRMGGVRAWREAERERRRWRAEWDPEAEAEGREKEEQEEQGLDEEGRKERELQREVLREQVEEERRVAGVRGVGDEEVGEGKEEEEEGFTMGMMLRSLNVDAEVVGYDGRAERWVD